MVDKKAQAALEFLTTYGWAFLVILIMIAALSYFGILNPSNLLPERCEFGNLMDCEGYEISYGGDDGATGQVRFQLMNKVGMDVVIDVINASTESTNSYNCNFTWDGGIWKDRTYRQFETSGDCHSADVQFSEGKKGKVMVDLVYHKVGADSYKHTAQGEIFSNVR